MRKLTTKFATGLISAAVLLTSFAPSGAIQMQSAPRAAPEAAASSDVQDVQYRRYYGGPGFYGPRFYGPRFYGPRYYGPRVYGGYYGRGWYGGYRGYPYYRRGYRYYDGYWFPLAAFGAGAVIGGAIAAPRYYEPAPTYVAPRAGINPSHVAWCESRYRSYRAYDNTFQPYRGPRQQCYSPYY